MPYQILYFPQERLENGRYQLDGCIGFIDVGLLPAAFHVLHDGSRLAGALHSEMASSHFSKVLFLAEAFLSRYISLTPENKWYDFSYDEHGKLTFKLRREWESEYHFGSGEIFEWCQEIDKYILYLLPEKLYILNEYSPMDFYKFKFFGCYVVSERFKRLVEDLEPGVHDFHPVTLYDSQLNEVEEAYYYLFMRQCRFFLDVEKSLPLGNIRLRKFDLDEERADNYAKYYGRKIHSVNSVSFKTTEKYYSVLERRHFTLKHVENMPPDYIFNADRYRGEHLWLENSHQDKNWFEWEYRSVSGPWCSDEFMREVFRRRLRGILFWSRAIFE